MNPEEKQALKATLAVLAAYYRSPLNDDVIRMYAEDLEDLDFDRVNLELRKYRRNPKNRVMPLPAVIREQISPETGLTDEHAAIEVAARIVTAISKFGYSNLEEARDYVGQIGWVVVAKQGGWKRLCQDLMAADVGMFQAQARELAKVQIRLARLGMLETAPQLPAPPPDRTALPARIGDVTRIIKKI